jgi:hypothetical protein
MDHDRAGDLIAVDVARDKHARAGLGTAAHAQATTTTRHHTCGVKPTERSVAVLWLVDRSGPGFSGSASGYTHVGGGGDYLAMMVCSSTG